MFSKVQISAKLVLETGLHIGGNSDFSAIGAIDSPVVKDSFTALPMIPGSSLKGKLRSLLAKNHNANGIPAATPDKDPQEITRLFGSMGKRSRLIFSDMVLANMDELHAYGIDNPTETKFENAINRLSGVANPRQIERVIRGSSFNCSIIYNAEDIAQMRDDIALLAEGMKFLRHDYLGGHGSRGYGRVRFQDVCIEVLTGEVPEDILKKCRQLLKEV